MLKSLHHAGAKLEMMLPYKIVNNKKVIRLVGVQYYFHTSLLWPVYYDNWRRTRRIIKKRCIWSLHLRNFLCLSVFASFLQKICGSSRNVFKFYIYIKLKLGTAKHIYLKWVFLPQWFPNTIVRNLVLPTKMHHLDMIWFRSNMNSLFLVLPHLVRRAPLCFVYIQHITQRITEWYLIY